MPGEGYVDTVIKFHTWGSLAQPEIAAHSNQYAAMPSLHVGLHFFFFLWSRRRARPLVVFFALATVLTFMGSILTGWHYAVDGYVGMLLAWICYRIGRWRDENDPAVDPAFPPPGGVIPLPVPNPPTGGPDSE